MERLRRAIQWTLAGGAVVFAAGVYLYLIRTSPKPTQLDSVARAPEVMVLPIEPTETETPVVAHGTVRAKHQIDIVPQVTGQLTEVHRNLSPGKIIPKGEILFQISTIMYTSRLRQAEAEIRGLEAAIERNQEELESLDSRLLTGHEMLGIEERDYLTSKRLYEEEKVGTQRDLDLVLQKYLRQKDLVAELRSRRAVVPHLLAETEAKLDAARAKLTQAQQDFENTTIRCPFKARVETVMAYKSQVVTAFFSIARLTDMEALEVSVGVDPRELRWLAPSIRPSTLSGDDKHDGPPVTVRWSLYGQEFVWVGRVTRFERVDEITRMARMVVEVRDVDLVATVETGPHDNRPELTVGMFCRTELPAEELEEALFVPRHAVYDNSHVFVFEPDATMGARGGHLARRDVPMLRPVGDRVLVDYRGREGTEVCELKPGERVVVSPLMKPVEGMRVRLREEESVASISAQGFEAVAGIISDNSRSFPDSEALASRLSPSGGDR